MKEIKRYIIILLMLLIVVVILQIAMIFIENQMKQFNEVDVVIEQNLENYIQVETEKELIEALKDEKIKIIDIKSDLDLGYNVLSQDGVDYKEIITKHNEPKTHPILKQTGVSKLKIKEKDGLIITSTNGSKILHTNIVIENSKNIKINNLEFAELWEWDEETQGEYDVQDWDYITIRNSENICVSNCEFSKAYDGITDIKGSKNVTIRYCKLNKMDIKDSFYDAQFKYLEENKEQYPIYKFLKDEINLSYEEIKELFSFQFKGYTIDTLNNEISDNVIIHDCLLLNLKTRIPRIREGKAYIYNVYVDSRKISKIMEQLLKSKKFELIKKSYSKIVALNSYGIIATKNALVITKNTIYEGAKYPYYVKRTRRRRWNYYKKRK